VTNNEKCKDKLGFGGMNLYNISNPANPSMLAEGVGDFTVNGQGKKDSNEIHSVFAWDAGDKAYAVIVDNEEGPDVDIIDITDPKKAKLVKEYDLDEFAPIEQASPNNLVEVFHHDVIVKPINGRQIMSVSYWDGGYVLLDVTDPLNAVYLRDSDFAAIDEQGAENGRTVKPESNAHQPEFTSDNAYLIGADEDFAPFALEATAGAATLQASSGSDPLQRVPGATLSGTAVFAGRACNIDPPPLAGPGGSQIAVVERGSCSFTEKVGRVIAAGGSEGILIFNRSGSDACDGALSMSVEGNIPTFGVAPRSQGLAIFGEPIEANCTSPAGADGALRADIDLGATSSTVLTFRSQFDGWGYVRLFKNPMTGGIEAAAGGHLRRGRGAEPVVRQRIRRPQRARSRRIGDEQPTPVLLVRRRRLPGPRHRQRSARREGPLHRARGQQLLGRAGVPARRQGVRRCERPRLRNRDLRIHRPLTHPNPVLPGVA
jgi:hypothetical protein